MTTVVQSRRLHPPAAARCDRWSPTDLRLGRLRSLRLGGLRLLGGLCLLVHRRVLPLIGGWGAPVPSCTPRAQGMGPRGTPERRYDDPCPVGNQRSTGPQGGTIACASSWRRSREPPRRGPQARRGRRVRDVPADGLRAGGESEPPMPLRRPDRHDAQGRGRGTPRRQGIGRAFCTTRLRYRQ